MCFINLWFYVKIVAESRALSYTIDVQVHVTNYRVMCQC